jgi:hypothetical protein
LDPRYDPWTLEPDWQAFGDGDGDALRTDLWAGDVELVSGANARRSAARGVGGRRI